MLKLDELLDDLTSGDEVRAAAAVPALLALGDDALAALQALLLSDDPDKRWWAICVLAQVSQSQTQNLLPFLNDESVEVRQAAALGLANHPHETAIAPLIRALSDPDSIVSGLACTALIQIGKAAVPSLLEVPSCAPAAARINAMRALAEIADHRAIPAMMAALDDESIMLNHWAEEGLERLGLNMVYLKPE